MSYYDFLYTNKVNCNLNNALVHKFNIKNKSSIRQKNVYKNIA